MTSDASPSQARQEEELNISILDEIETYLFDLTSVDLDTLFRVDKSILVKGSQSVVESLSLLDGSVSGYRAPPYAEADDHSGWTATSENGTS